MRLQTETCRRSSESNLIFFYQRALALRTRVFACVVTKRHPRKLHFTLFSPNEIVWLFIPKEVKPSPDSKMILKLLTFDNLFPPLLHSR